MGRKKTRITQETEELIGRLMWSLATSCGLWDAGLNQSKFGWWENRWDRRRDFAHHFLELLLADDQQFTATTPIPAVKSVRPCYLYVGHMSKFYRFHSVATLSKVLTPHCTTPLIFHQNNNCLSNKIIFLKQLNPIFKGKGHLLIHCTPLVHMLYNFQNRILCCNW